MIKKWLKYLTIPVLIFVLILTGCTKSPEVVETPEEPIEITFWHAMGGGKLLALEKMVESFNASHSNIHVTPIYQNSYDEIITKFKTGVQTNTLPDVVQLLNINTKFAVESKATVPIQVYIDKYGYNDDDLVGVMKGYYTVNGSLQAMPFNVSTTILYYNKDAFIEAGLDPNSPPKTYDEILEIAPILAEKSSCTYGFAHAIHGWIFEQGIATLGQYYGNNENGRAGNLTAVEFDKNGAGKKVFENWLRAFNTEGVGNYGSVTSDTQSAFFAGQLCMFPETPGILPDIYKSINFQLGTSTFPLIEENENGGVLIGGGALFMSDTGDEARMDAAWKFIEYTTEPEVQAQWALDSGYIPVTISSYETDAYQALIKSDPNYATAFIQLKESPENNYTAGIYTGVGNEARKFFAEAMEGLYEGKYTVDEAVAWLAEQVNASITAYNESIK